VDPQGAVGGTSPEGVAKVVPVGWVAAAAAAAALALGVALTDCGPRRDLPSGATDVTERRESYEGLEGDFVYELGATVSPAGFEEFVRDHQLTPGVPPDCAPSCSGMSHARQLGREHCECARYDGGRLEFLSTSW
jgi:hypothetical protein